MDTRSSDTGLVTLFLSGDVMTGRGVDQILPHPVDSKIHESFMTSALGYVTLAERAHGPVPRPVAFDYVWGDALRELERARPDARIINLETAVTSSDAFWAGKGINYRMHPRNVPCLTAAGIDCCTLANNHVLDWGYPGLTETLQTLKAAGIATAGAGGNSTAARAPAVIEVPGKGRVTVFSLGSTTSGIPRAWAATDERAGVHLIDDLSAAAVRGIATTVHDLTRPGDVVIASVHWGSNWGYTVPPAQRAFAHRLIDEAGVDLVHGHSSHHPRPIEVHRGKLVLYGCGDLLNDYEGITGHERYRGDLGLMYFATVDPATGLLAGLRMIPTRIRRLRLNRAGVEDARWLAEVLTREGKAFGTRVELQEEDASLVLRWGERDDATKSPGHD